MKKSGLLARHDARTKDLIEISGDVNRQIVVDCLTMMLYDPNDMKGRPWYPKQIEEFVMRLCERVDEYYEALYTGPESDYYREKLDRGIRPIYKDRFQPFPVRYPCIKEIFYGLRKRH